MTRPIRKLDLQPFRASPPLATGVLRISTISGVPYKTQAFFSPRFNIPAILRLKKPHTIPSAASIATILQAKSSTGPWNMGWEYDLVHVASGETRYPRLEALVAHLVGHLSSPYIIERGPGRYAALSVALARHYKITVIEKLSHVRPNYDGLPASIRGNIQLLDIAQVPASPIADLAIWIHPIPYVMMGYHGIFDFSVMGQDIKPGGYLVVQTEVNCTIPESPEWELVYSGLNIGFLAPTHFTGFPGKTLVLRRAPSLPADWHTLAQSNPDAFSARVRSKIAAIKIALEECIAQRELASVTAAWYQKHILPELEIMNAAFKTHFPRALTTGRHTLARDLMIMSNAIPVFLMAEDTMKVSVTLDEVGK